MTRPVTAEKYSANQVQHVQALRRRGTTVPTGKSRAIRKSRTGAGKRAAIRNSRES